MHDSTCSETLAPLLHEYKKHAGDGADEAAHESAYADAAHGTSFLNTCFNGLNALSGVGILSMPYALAEGGWLSLVLFLAVAIICYYTGLLLLRCMDADENIRTYPDIGEYAFGYKGRIIISLFMYLELYLVAIGFLILEGDNLDKLFPTTNFEFGILKVGGKQLFTLLAALLFLPTVWLRSLGVLAYVSVGGVLASVVVVCSVMWAGAFGNVGFHKRDRLLNLSGIPTSMGLYVFCFCGHAVFPTLCTSMKKRTHFPKVLLICFFLCALNYGVMAIFGYLMYGEHVNAQVTLELPKGHVSTKIAIYTTLINPLTRYALILTPIATAIEERLVPLQDGKRRSSSFFLRTLLVVSTVVIALMVPLFAQLMSLVGSFLSITASVLFPCLCYLKIFEVGRRSMFELVIVVGILANGVLVACVGTYTSLREIIHSL